MFLFNFLFMAFNFKFLTILNTLYSIIPTPCSSPILAKAKITLPLWQLAQHLTILWKLILREESSKSAAWFLSNPYSQSSGAALSPHW